MPSWLLDLLSWTFAFVFLFVLFRHLQKRKKNDEDK